MSLGFNKGSSKSSSNQTSNQTSTPNNLSALQQLWPQATDLANGNNSAANNALSLLTNNANTVSGAANNALTTATGLANGGTANPANAYLTPYADGSMTGANNPYFSQLAKQISQQVQGATDGNFAASGRYGSGANANAFNSAVTNQVGQLGFADYNNSLDRQLQAAGQLSANNANSTNAALAALGVIPSLGTTATNAGQAAFQGAVAPLNAAANVLSLLGSGGGTVKGNQSGTTTGKQSSSSLSFDPFDVFKSLGL